MKPVRLVCYVFLWTLLTVHNVQKHSYHFDLIGVYLYSSMTHLPILCFHCDTIKNKNERR